MTMTLQAVFENGVLRPLAPLSLPEGQQVQVLVSREDVVPLEASGSAASRNSFVIACNALTAGRRILRVAGGHAEEPSSIWIVSILTLISP